MVRYYYIKKFLSYFSREHICILQIVSWNAITCMYIRNISGHFKYKRKNLDLVFLLPYYFAKNPLHLLAIMTELTEFERGIIIGAWLFDHSEWEIEAKTGYAKSTIHDTIERYRETGGATSRPRSGRPQLLSDRDKWHLVRIVQSNRQQSAKQARNNFVQSSGTVASLSTVRRALYEAGYHSRVAVRKPFISVKNRQDRLKWCRRHQEWTDEQWKKVIWSDESRFTLFQSDGRTHVWRLPKEKYDVNCIVPTVKHGGGGVMVWGCFTWDSLGPLVRVEGIINSQRYIDILNAHLIPFMEGLEGEIVDYEFQQDNASVHKSKLTMTLIPLNICGTSLNDVLDNRTQHQRLSKNWLNSSRMEENPKHHISKSNFKHET